ncbi:MAG: hypothetical protein O6913_05870 [Chloroflexi bacterium]|nr:hypothetical protein [Chloroflexota bacterium]
MSRGAKALERQSQPPDRASRFRAGLKSIPQALWFLISLVIYALGLVLVTLGSGLIRLSGWGTARESTPAIDADGSLATPRPHSDEASEDKPTNLRRPAKD